MSVYRNFMDYHIEQLRDPEDAKIYLTVALDDYEKNGDIEAFLLAVRDVAEAQGNSNVTTGNYERRRLIRFTGL